MEEETTWESSHTDIVFGGARLSRHGRQSVKSTARLQLCRRVLVRKPRPPLQRRNGPGGRRDAKPRSGMKTASRCCCRLCPTLAAHSSSATVPTILARCRSAPFALSPIGGARLRNSMPWPTPPTDPMKSRRSTLACTRPNSLGNADVSPTREMFRKRLDRAGFPGAVVVGGIDTAISDAPKLVKFAAFDPTKKMSEATATDETGNPLHIVKGAFSAVIGLVQPSPTAEGAAKELEDKGFSVLAVAAGPTAAMRLVRTSSPLATRLAKTPRRSSANCKGWASAP